MRHSDSNYFQITAKRKFRKFGGLSINPTNHEAFHCSCEAHSVQISLDWRRIQSSVNISHIPSFRKYNIYVKCFSTIICPFCLGSRWFVCPNAWQSRFLGMTKLLGVSNEQGINTTVHMKVDLPPLNKHRDNILRLQYNRYGTNILISFLVKISEKFTAQIHSASFRLIAVI